LTNTRPDEDDTRTLEFTAPILTAVLRLLKVPQDIYENLEPWKEP
jgi:hypothetical protein